jgi:hypothetical protein
MKPALKILAGVMVVAVVAIAGWRYHQMHRAQQAGLLTENIGHDGDIWKAEFTARIPAPEQTVFNTIRDIENMHTDQVKAVRVVSQSGNKKTVDMDIPGPAGRTNTIELQFEYLPEDKKIVFHTVNNPVVDIETVYQLGDEGASTFIDYHGTTHLLHPLPVPDAVIKQLIHAIFVAQLESLKHALNLKIADAPSSGGEDEP